MNKGYFMHLILCMLFFASAFTLSAQTQTVFFTEDFSTGALPTGWSTEGNNSVWEFNNPMGRSPGGSFDGHFAIYDTGSQSAGWGSTYLKTGAIDFSDYGNVIVSFDARKVISGSGSELFFEVSNDENNWSQFQVCSGPWSHFGPAKVTYDITAFAAGESTVYLRWTHFNEWGVGGLYSAIDNLEFITYEGLPLPASLASPANGVIDFQLGSSLSWNVPQFSPTIDGYTVYLDTMNPPSASFNVGNVLQYEPELAYGTVYYWQVIPYNATGSADRAESQTWSFETPVANPLPVTMVSPADEATNIVLSSALQWQAPTNGIAPTGYYIYLDDVNPPVEFEDVGNVLTYAPGFEPSTTYYWRVVPYSAGGSTPIGDTTVRSFTTNDPQPLPATLVGPADNATEIAIFQALRWQHAVLGEQATGYRVYLDTVDPPTYLAYEGPNTTHQHSLEPSTEYFWQVVPFNATGDAIDTPVWSFSTSGIASLPLDEKFTEMVRPTDWQSIDVNGTGHTWVFDNPHNLNPGNLFQGGFASVRRAGSTPVVLSQLITPAIDCSGVDDVRVSFTHRYLRATGPLGDVQFAVSTDGVNWTTLQTWGATVNQRNEAFDITEHAAGEGTVYLRWQFRTTRTTTGTTWYAVDNVLVHGPMVPFAANLTAPANGAINRPLDTNLTWTAPTLGSAPTGYNVYIDTMNPPVAMFNVGNALSYSPELAHSTTYFWRVVPYNALGSTPLEDTDVRSFSTIVLHPLPAVLTAPEHQQFHLQPDAVTLRWDANTQGEPATGYRVYFGTDNPPETMVFDDEELLKEHTVVGLEYDTTYNWRVIPYNDNAPTPTEMCEVREFTTAKPPLEAGTYIVNLDPEVGDFSSVREAAEAVSYRGILGPVVIDVNPGLYDDGGAVDMDPILITAVAGADADNWVTFTNSITDEPAFIAVNTPIYWPGDPDNPEIQCNLYLYGAKFVRIENLFFRNYTGIEKNHIGIAGNASDIEIVNCYFNYDEGSLRAIETSNSHKILIENNTINSIGFGGLKVRGTSDNYSQGIRIINNKFTVGSNAIDIDLVDAFIISNNVMDITNTGYGTRGMRWIRTRGAFLFDSNRIFFSNSDEDSGGHYGWSWGESFIGTTGGHISDGKPAIIVNNMIGGGLTHNHDWTSIMRVEAEIHDIHFYFNSFRLDISSQHATDMFSWLPRPTEGSSGLVFLNNSFAYTGGANARCFRAEQEMVDAFDYNNFYSNGAKFAWYGGEVENLPQLQAVDGKNQNSRVGDPEYVSKIDLHSFGTQLWQAGTPIDGFDYDIDGDERHPTMPNIGADEYEPIVDFDLAATAINGPSMLTVGIPATFEITLENPGTLMQQDYTVKLMKEGDIELVSMDFTEPIIWAGTTEVVTIQWTPTEEDMFDIYAKVVLENDQNPYNDVSPMHAVMIMGVTELDAPVVTLTVNPVTNVGTLTWEAVASANSYRVYGSLEPYNEAEWILLTITAATEVTANLAGYGDNAFFRVIASTDSPAMFIGTPSLDRRNRNNRTRDSGFNSRDRGE